VDVTPGTALRSSAVYACVRVLAETVASLPLPVYVRLENGGKARANDHPLYAILHDAPNPEMTSFELRELLMGHLCLWGNAFAEILRDGNGQALALWPLRPDKITIKRGFVEVVGGGNGYGRVIFQENPAGGLVYGYELPAGAGRTMFLARNMLHVKALSTDGVIGLSPITMMRQAIGLTMATEEFGSRFFGNDARPGMVLEHPGKLSQQAHDNLKESWEERHMGLENAHRVAILEEGLKAHEVGVPPEDAQFLETRKFQVNDIARIFRVPPHMVGDLERATFSNVEQQAIDFVVHTIRPWLVKWEQALSQKLFTEQDRRSYFTEFLVDGLLRGDIQSRYLAYAQGRQNGWLSTNDVRVLENMNPVDGGDVYLIPLNMVAAGTGNANALTPRAGQSPAPTDGLQERGEKERGEEFTPSPRGQVNDPPLPGDLTPRAGQSPAPTAGEGNLEERARWADDRKRIMASYKRIYKEVAGRIIKRETNDIKGAIKRILVKQGQGQFEAWLGGFWSDHGEFVKKQMKPVTQSYGELVSHDVEAEINKVIEPARLEGFVDGYVDEYAKRHVIKSKEALGKRYKDALAGGKDLVEELNAELDGWDEGRPEEIASNESVRANNAVAFFIYLAAGVQLLRWYAGAKPCPFCQEMDGKVVGIDTPFFSKGDEFTPEGGGDVLKISHDVGHPPLHDGCQCLVGAG
jgi:HK97 family phage portal protein